MKKIKPDLVIFLVLDSLVVIFVIVAVLMKG
jgi:hypothetical protein